MPEIVEPKQLIQSRVLVKRARLTVKRGATRKEKMPPNIISGKSSGGKHLKFVLEVTPPNVHIVPKVLGLHLSTFTLKGFSTHRDKRGMPSG